MNIIDTTNIQHTDMRICPNVIRKRRESECFPIVNRGLPWYNCLTVEQRAELNGWYHAWLNATETGIIPSKPSWLNDKIKKEEILL